MEGAASIASRRAQINMHLVRALFLVTLLAAHGTAAGRPGAGRAAPADGDASSTGTAAAGGDSAPRTPTPAGNATALAQGGRAASGSRRGPGHRGPGSERPEAAGGFPVTAAAAMQSELVCSAAFGGDEWPGPRVFDRSAPPHAPPMPRHPNGASQLGGRHAPVRQLVRPPLGLWPARGRRRRVLPGACARACGSSRRRRRSALACARRGSKARAQGRGRAASGSKRSGGCALPPACGWPRSAPKATASQPRDALPPPLPLSKRTRTLARVCANKRRSTTTATTTAATLIALVITNSWSASQGSTSPPAPSARARLGTWRPCTSQTRCAARVGTSGFGGATRSPPSCGR